MIVYFLLNIPKTNYSHLTSFCSNMMIVKHTKVDMIWVTRRSPTLVSHRLRGVAMNVKATTLTYLAIYSAVAIENILNWAPPQTFVLSVSESYRGTSRLMPKIRAAFVIRFLFSMKLIVIANKFATFALTCKPCPRRGYRDYQCLKMLHFLVK